MFRPQPNHMVTPVVSGGAPAFAAAPASAPGAAAGEGRSVARFRLEATLLLLLLATVGAILFQNLFVSKTLSLTPSQIHSRFDPYSYDDSGNGGKSTIHVYQSRPLHWSCDLRAGYAYPFCGYGLFFDKGVTGEGYDLSQYRKVTVRLRYTGPATKLRISLMNSDPRYRAAGAKPNQAELPLRQGLQEVTVPFDELNVAFWWADQKHVPKPLALEQHDNVTAMEIQPVSDHALGHHEFEVESIVFHGEAMSQAQFYLVLLIGWTVMSGLLLAWRVVVIRRGFERRHARELRYRGELEVARNAAEGASAAKSAFLANMSHELRTPLNAIIGYAQLLERAKLDAREAAAARTIHRSGTHLLTLITDILDLSKIEAGRLELQPEPFDLHALVQGVGDMMKMQARERGLDFSCTVRQGVPQRVIGDAKRLRQVLINLLGNAIKFTLEGEVSLRLTPLPSDGRAARMRIEVRDTGVGMEDAELERIFEPFEQVGERECRIAGTGLGLSITRQIVDLMGGRMNVESTPGQGSRFWFDVALDQEAAVPAIAAPTTAAAAPAETQAPVASGAGRAAEPQPGAEPDPAPPPAERLRELLTLAKAGNMRAIHKFAEALAESDLDCAPFADRVKTLAAAYQSRAILDLVSRHVHARKAA